LLRRRILTPEYWSHSLQITDEDIEFLFSVMLEDELPLDVRRMVRLVIEHRVRQEEDDWRKHLKEGTLFQPRAQYTVGQKLVFPALRFALGTVVGVRPGSNPEYGDFTVIQVEFPGGLQREFASELKAPHALDLDNGDSPLDQLLEPVDIDALEKTYGDALAQELEERLSVIDDVAYAGGLWFLKSLLPAIDRGHTNLTEALLDMHKGGPLAPEDILPILDLPAEVNPRLQAFALNWALYNDNRFDEVGSAGLVRWYLRRLEPEEVQRTPERLVYERIPYNRDLLTAEDLALEAEIGDEHSELPEVKGPVDRVTIVLNYPHRRSGTLPLTAGLSAMLPTAYEAERILITLLDGITGDKYTGWVVRAGRYVCGLERIYRKHKLPVGAVIYVQATELPGHFQISFDGYRPRTEWITMIEPRGGRLSFANQRRLIGAAYDQLMVLGADDLEGIDAIWRTVRDQKRSLIEIIRDILPELARLNPQSAVHAKTLYSAVNVVRRCPPGPILAALEAQPEFTHVGGHYWRYERGA